MLIKLNRSKHHEAICGWFLSVNFNQNPEEDNMKTLTLETVEKTLNAQLADLERQWNQAVEWKDDSLKTRLQIMGDTVRHSLALLQEVA